MINACHIYKTLWYLSTVFKDLLNYRDLKRGEFRVDIFKRNSPLKHRLHKTPTSKIKVFKSSHFMSEFTINQTFSVFIYCEMSTYYWYIRPHMCASLGLVYIHWRRTVSCEFPECTMRVCSCSIRFERVKIGEMHVSLLDCNSNIISRSVHLSESISNIRMWLLGKMSKNCWKSSKIFGKSSNFSRKFLYLWLFSHLLSFCSYVSLG